MKRIASALAAVAVATLGTLALASPAVATEDEPHPVKSDCIEGWYTNPDEGDRLPEQTEDGLLFQPADLVHHGANIPLDELGDGGTFVADPAPDQPSFFSVEVRNEAGAYGTLRWNPATSEWSITIGAGAGATDGTFYDADPVALLTDKVTKWGAFNESDVYVVSFGVGYTQNPPGTVETTVSSVTFAGTTYDLTCKPEPPATETETTPPATETTTTEPATTTTTSAAATLPVTGSGLTGLIAVAAVLVVAGAAVVVVARRRRA